MFGDEWILKFSRTAKAATDRYDRIIKPIQPIEPDAVFTNKIVGVYVSSSSASKRWYFGGKLYQAFIVPFGTAGYAQGAEKKITLWRHHIFNFTELPFSTTEYKYLLSFDPPNWFKDVNIFCWEYQGINQGKSNEEIFDIAVLNLRQSQKNQASINALAKKIKDK
jgi:hypothetical protein